MTGRHSGLGWPGAIGDHARDATAPPYIGRHRMDEYCPPPTDRLCNCNQCRREWQQRESELRDPRRCEGCGHLEDRCECPHDCTYPEGTDV